VDSGWGGWAPDERAQQEAVSHYLCAFRRSRTVRLRVAVHVAVVVVAVSRSG
jgi:hypothetical protein